MEHRYNLYNLEPEYKQYLLVKDLSARSIKNYLSDTRHFIGWLISVKIERNISQKLVDAYISYLSLAQTPAKTTNRRLTSLRKYFEFLKDNYQQDISQISIKNIPTQLSPSKSLNELSSHETPVSNSVLKSHHKNSPKYNVIPYLLNIAIILLLTFAGISSWKYYSSLKNEKTSVAIKTNPDGRILLFSGTVKDSIGNIIDTKTDLRFNLYPSSESSRVVYSGSCTGESGVTPSIRGLVKVNVGKDCGMKPIPNEIFLNEQSLYLGITIGADKEMSPRKQIPNTGYSLNSDQLQGLKIGYDVNSIPFINDEGSVILGSSNASIISTSEDSPLTIESAQNLTVRSGFGSDLSFEAQESGNIAFKTGGFEESVPQMYISNYGNVGVGSLNPEEYKLQVAGDIGPDSDDIYDLGSETGQWANLYASKIFQNGVPLCDKEGNNCPTDTSWISSDPIIYQNTPSQKIGIGTNSASDIESQLYVTRDILSGPTGKSLAIFNQTENQDIIAASSSGSLRFVVKNSGNTGIGTINPSARLDVSGGQTKIEVSTQYTQRLCHSGNELTSSQNVLLGDCSSTSADIAEYYGTNDPTIEPGDLVSIGKSGSIDNHSSKGYVKRTSEPNDLRLIGVVSTNPYDSFGNNFTDNEKAVPVALAGRVPLKISKLSMDIKTGDPITSSHEQGKGMKALQSGRIVGFALEDWTASSSKNNLLTFINPGWHDPEVTIGNDGNLKNINTSDNSISYTYDGSITNGEFNLNSNTYDRFIQMIEKSASIITNNLIVREKLLSPIIETKTIIATGDAKLNTVAANSIRPNSSKLIIDLGNDNIDKSTSTREAEMTELIIKGLDRIRAASIDGLGNATFSGQINAESASLSGSLLSHQIKTDSITTNGINSNVATIAGTLRAGKIDSETISQINQKIDSLESSTSGLVKSLSSSGDDAIQKLNTTVNDIQKLIGSIKNTSVTDTRLTSALPDVNSTDTTELSNTGTDVKYSNLLSPDEKNLYLDQLSVSNNTDLYRVNIADSLTAGSILVEKDSILSLSWELKFSALSTISFFDGAVIIAKDGTIITNGEVIANAGIKTDQISSIGNDLTIKLNGTNSEVSDGSSSKLIIANAAGDSIGSIDDKGTASFNGLTLDSFTDTSISSVISASNNLQANGIYSPAIETDMKTAGVGLIPENNSEIIIYNDRVSSNSLIYLTPTDEIVNTQLSVVKKESCNEGDKYNKLENCRPYFKIAASNISPTEIKFNWLIIN